LEVQLPLMFNPDVVLSFTNSAYDACPDNDFFSIVGLSFGHGQVIISDPISSVSRFEGTGIMTSSIICRKSALRRIGGFDERMRVYNDARVQFRLAMEGKFAVATEPLVIWNKSDSAGHLSKPSYSFFKESANAGTEILSEFYVRAVNSPSDIQKRIRRKLSYFLTRQSEYLALDGRYGMARRKAFESLVFVPRGNSALRAIIGLFLPRAFHLLSKYKKEI
jgi:GT2 family glycosyltransferase